MAEFTKGQLIALRRDKLGWTQLDLADKMGVSRSTVLRIEKDTNRQPTNYAAAWAAIEKEETKRGLRPTLSAGSGTTDPSMKEGDDAAAKLRRVDVRLERIEVFLVDTLEAVKRARADLLADSSDERRKRG